MVSRSKAEKIWSLRQRLNIISALKLVIHTLCTKTEASSSYAAASCSRALTSHFTWKPKWICHWWSHLYAIYMWGRGHRSGKSLSALQQLVSSKSTVYFKRDTFVLDRVHSLKNKSGEFTEEDWIFWVELSAQTGCCHVRSDIIKSEHGPARHWGPQRGLESLISAPFNSPQGGDSCTDNWECSIYLRPW